MPTLAPTPIAQGSLPSLANGGLANGVEPPTGSFIAAGWVPYASTSVWNTPVCNSANQQCANMTYTSNSAAVVNTMITNGSTGYPIRNEEAGPYDYAYALYYASTSDPLVNLVCTGYCASGNGGLPKQIYVPAKARFPGCNGNNCSGYYSDAVAAFVQPGASATVIDTAYGQPKIGRDWQTGDTMSVGGGANCGNFYTGTGWIDYNGSFGGIGASGGCSPPGRLLASELLAGKINHALKILAPCAGSTGDGRTEQPSVYPAYPGTQTQVCTQASANVGVPLGSHLWYDVPDSVTNALAIAPWVKAILNCLHDYGAYFTDNDGGGATMSYFHFMPDSGEEFQAFGTPNPWAALVNAPNNWTSATINGSLQPRYFGNYQDSNGNFAPPVPNFASHLHWLAPCNAQSQC